ncbi:MAG: hypothetical protein FWE70_05335 [Oscillospiraceae bacterium]|nr:hypothetical protein [Oscillospiraceae bacterium]
MWGIGRKWVLAAASALAVASILGVAAFSPVLNVTSIEVKGNTRYREEDIVRDSGVELGQNALTFLMGAEGLTANLKNLLSLRLMNREWLIAKGRPYIKEVTVRYSPMGRFTIEVSERVPMAVISSSGGYLVDGDAYVVDRAAEGDRRALPTIVGIELGAAPIGGALEGEDYYKFENFALIWAAICESDRDGGDALGDRVECVDVGDVAGPILRLEGGVDVVFDEMERLVYKVDAVKQVLLSLEGPEMGSGVRILFSGRNINVIPKEGG